jgi:chromate transporter
MHDDLSAGPPGTRRPSCRELAFAFGWITLVAFGGGAPWVKQVAVDERRWLTQAEFAEVTALSQSIPGAIFFNLAAVIGVREQGVRGAASALLGILVPAIAVACIIHHALRGIVAAAAGLFASTWLQITASTWKLLGLPGMGIAALALGGVAYFHWSLPLVILAILPLALLTAWRLVR